MLSLSNAHMCSLRHDGECIQFHPIYFFNASRKICSAFRSIGFGFTSMRRLDFDSISDVTIHHKSSWNISIGLSVSPKLLDLIMMPWNFEFVFNLFLFSRNSKWIEIRERESFLRKRNIFKRKTLKRCIISLLIRFKASKRNHHDLDELTKLETFKEPAERKDFKCWISRKHKKWRRSSARLPVNNPPTIAMLNVERMPNNW